MSVLSWLTSQPIAHRGLYDPAEGAPENSLAAFRRAVARTIPFEFDVQCSADGCPIVWHDAKVKLPEGTVTSVPELSSNELTKLHIGDTEERVPTLAQVLEVADGEVPIVVDVRRYGFDRHGRLERAIVAELRHYPGPAALQSFDPFAVFRFGRLAGDRRVGQASGELHSANALVAAIGRAMPTNIITHPDFISYEITRLPSFWTDFWRRRGVPVLAFPVEDERDEQRASRLADNFFFSGYLPRSYRTAAGTDG